MPEISTLISYITIVSLLLIIPGPTIIYVVTATIKYGYDKGKWSILGVALADLTSSSACVFGLGIMLVLYPQIYQIILYVSCLYMIYLSIKFISSGVKGLFSDFNPYIFDDKPDQIINGEANKIGRSIFYNSFFITVLNPKGIVFFLALFPQFIDTSKSTSTQLSIFVLIFVILGTLNAFLYCFLSGKVTALINNNNKIFSLFELCAGLLLFTAAITSLFD